MCNTVQTWLVQLWLREFSQQLQCLMFDFCARIFHHHSVNHISTNLTNITLRMLWLTCYIWFVMLVREWLISKSFFTIKATFFDIKTREHTYFTSSYICWWFHFCSKAASTWQSHSQRFLPRCMECRRGLAMRILSVRPSVTRVNCDKTVERSVQIYIPYERTFILVF